MSPAPLRHVAAAGLAALGHDPDRVRDLARDLLSRPPYQPERGMLGELVAWVRRRIAQALADFLAALELGSAGAWAIAIIGLALLIAAVWFWTRGFAVDRAAPAVAPVAATRSVDEWLAEADRAADEGRWRDALRAHYAALLVALTDAGVLEDLPGRTPRELADEVARTAPDLGPACGEVAHRFEEAWYGGLPAGRDDVRRAREVVADVRSRRARVRVPA